MPCASRGRVNPQQIEAEVEGFFVYSLSAARLLGDAIQTAPLMPKSAHMDNQYAKVRTAAVVDLLSGRAPKPRPLLTNTCYNYVSDQEVIHVASSWAANIWADTLM